VSSAACGLSGWNRYSAFAANAARSAPGRRTSSAEHCCVIPSILCRFHASESARSAPAIRPRCADDSNADAPNVPSTCSHAPCRAQTSAIPSIASNAPSTVVPAVALTKNGRSPRSLAACIAAASASTRICPRTSHGTAISARRPSPSSAADFFSE